MSLNVEGSSCVVCHAYLFEEDDIVYCPVCGAPHHRDCYNSVGHCGLEDFHGTERQYDKIKDELVRDKAAENNGDKGRYDNLNDKNDSGTVVCRMCQKKYDSRLNTCPNCGAVNISKMGVKFVNFDFLEGVPADYDIGEGVTASEAKCFVVANTQRYIPKFAILNKSNKLSWNWAAFLFPCGWMLSRKMYKNGIITGMLSVISSLLALPLNSIISNLGTSGKEGYAELFDSFYQALPEISTAVIVASAVGAILNLALRFGLAIFGDYIYKKHAIEAIKNIRQKSDGIDYDMRKNGGISFFMFVLGSMAVEYIPMIIGNFIS